MAFTKKHIPSKTLCIIDIGSYKLRVSAARFKNKRIHVLGYSEKRQDMSYFANQECLNLPGLCTNISEAIEKLEKQIDLSLDQVIINYPFGELFLGSKKINYKRKFPHKDISLEELEDIMQRVEKLCLKNLTAQVDKLYGLSESEVQILLSRVNSVSIDGKQHEKIIGKQGENMKISLLNAFIPSGKHTLLSQIGNVINKDIFRVLPTEYCITKIFKQKDLVVINIGATQTTISLKLESDVVGISKIPIGINDLVTKISKKHNHDSRAEIIEKLSEDFYKDEKEDFLRVWGESIGITLQEMLGKEICPKHIYIGGGGGNNNFIQNYLQNFNFAKYDIRIIGDVVFIKEDMTDILKPMKYIQIEDIQRIPLDMYVLLLETNHIISKEKDVVSSSLKTAIKKLGYIKS